MMWERFSRIVKSHRTTYNIARNAYGRYLNVSRRYQNVKLKEEFRSRIDQINPDEYLDISCKPDLNVIILVIDSLRNSRLSFQGYFRETTPFLDSFKLRFTAISASPWTYPSVASILTGLYPHNHNAVLGGKIKDWRNYESYLKIRSSILTLPEMLFLLGYRVYFGTAIPPAFWAVSASAVPNICDVFWRADEILVDTTKWISRGKGKKFLAYVHLGDLHPPLNPPDSFRNFFGDIKNLSNIDDWDFVRSQHRENEAEKFAEYKENRQLLYDNTLRYVDSAVRRFYNTLKDMGLLDSTVFIITADHGEQFWEHAELDAKSFYLLRGVSGISHDTVYNEVIQVPWLMSGRVPDKKGKGFVSAVDIVPTVVDLLGIAHKMRFDGQNIFKTEGERPLLSEAVSCGYEKKALIIGRYKLIYSKDDRLEWLFDLEKDPHEQNPIIDRQVTSVYVEKLLRILKEDEKEKIREITGKKSLLKAFYLD